MLAEETKKKIEALVAANDVVLFMKGTRSAPQCGFSSQVVQILDRFLDDYATVNVLADHEVREGVKAFSDWPTIPQLYIKGEFQGGCDIVKNMFASGELKQKLGVDVKSVAAPNITVTAAAKEAIEKARGGQPAEEAWLHLEVDAAFRTNMGFGPREPDDVLVEAGGFQLLVDFATAKRSNGITIDFVGGASGGFKIDNPNAPAPVGQITVKELAALLGGPAKIELIDVRGADEWQKAHINGARLLDQATQAYLQGLDKNTPLYFHCHHGGRSQRAAEQYQRLGFKKVFNVVGGIDAWSIEVDQNVPRY